MIVKLFSVFDVKSAVFDAPRPYINEGAAIRAFGDAVNSKETAWSAHPEDYSLVMIGEYDDSIGMVVARQHSVLCTAASLVRHGAPSVPLQLGEMVKNGAEVLQ